MGSELNHIDYWNGDHIWLDQTGKVVKVITHDGVYWEEGMTSLGRVSALGGGGADDNRSPGLAVFLKLPLFIKKHGHLLSHTILPVLVMLAIIGYLIWQR